nr:Plug domain-containing protein [Helicobacter cetorum]
MFISLILGLISINAKKLPFYLEPLYFPDYQEFLKLKPHFLHPKKHAYKPFKWGNTIIIKRKDLEQRQSNQPSDIFRQNAEINVSSQTFLRGLNNNLSRVILDSVAQ